MSWRQPANMTAAVTKDTKERTQDTKGGLVSNGRDLPGPESRQEFAGAFEIEFRVVGLDAQEEPVPARQSETRHVEHRVVGLRQAVQRQHAQHRGERGDEN